MNLDSEFNLFRKINKFVNKKNKIHLKSYGAGLDFLRIIRFNTIMDNRTEIINCLKMIFVSTTVLLSKIKINIHRVSKG